MKEFPLKKARRVTTAEMKQFRKAIENTFGKKRQVRRRKGEIR